MQKILLASTSPARRQLLDRLSVAYDAVPHRVDEAAAKETFLSSRTLGDGSGLATALAKAKARSVLELAGGRHVLASDQVAVAKGSLLKKPTSLGEVKAQLRRLAGITHTLTTAAAWHAPDGTLHSAAVTHQMTMLALTEDEIVRYAERDAAIGCIGGYKIECAGVALFERIEGNDFTAIIGLPLLTVSRWLRAAGFPLLGHAPVGATQQGG